VQAFSRQAINNLMDSMSILNFEFKAVSNNIKSQEDKLLLLNAEFIGEDNQTDTYFNVKQGRLKLREGNIENSLIWYNRENIKGAKQSDVLLYRHNPDKAQKDILVKVHGIKVIVNKKRRIYFLGNVKFHFDEINGFGTFVEVEAIDKDGSIGIEKLKEQCNKYAELFNIRQQDFMSLSYSDKLLQKNKG
jgi:adenylate cyclase, class 2